MIPKDQRILYSADPLVRGDCFRACVCSILHLDGCGVPNFAEDWPDSFISFCLKWDIEWTTEASIPGGYAIAMGPGARGVGHAVVVLDGALMHDPHPSRAGLLSVDEYMVVARQGT